jgi:RNase H-fold protein (predicted Holliday junction resolvase)
LAIDPGTAKCGIAVVERTADVPRTLHREIVPTPELTARIIALTAASRIVTVLIGNATNGKKLAQELRAALPIETAIHSVPEAYTSERARVRYDRENPPKGWHRLIPTGLRTPPEPYDDYVAVLLAEDYFAAKAPDS